MKSVLISIQPKWCELIASGKKTIEVRKTRPKIDVPFKCYIYCTKSRDMLWVLKKSERTYTDKPTSIFDAKDVGGATKANGKVIGEFVCDDIFADKTFGHYGIFKTSACMSDADISAYCLNKEMYCWHISDLVIYDEPKELSEFYVLDDKAIKECEHRERIYVNPDSVNGAWLKGSYICTKGEEEWCSKCKTKPITRPPQSWCYVEGADGE
jgi:predicted transcriptional regulator